jgi:hypothetical protein
MVSQSSKRVYHYLCFILMRCRRLDVGVEYREGGLIGTRFFMNIHLRNRAALHFSSSNDEIDA